MNDLDSMLAREQVFQRKRALLNELNDSSEQLNDLLDRVKEMRKKRNELKEEISRTTRLIEVMIDHDCCPTEARLKHGDLLEADDVRVMFDYEFIDTDDTDDPSSHEDYPVDNDFIGVKKCVTRI